MNMAPGGIPLTFEVTYSDASLDVGMIVFDDSGVTPVQVGGVIPMSNFFGTTYRAKFTPTAGKNYIVIKAVYTDGTFTLIDDDYGRGTESFIAYDFAAAVLDVLISQHNSIGTVGGAIAAAAGSSFSGNPFIEGQVVSPQIIVGIVNEGDL